MKLRSRNKLAVSSVVGTSESCSDIDTNSHVDLSSSSSDCGDEHDSAYIVSEESSDNDGMDEDESLTIYREEVLRPETPEVAVESVFDSFPGPMKVSVLDEKRKRLQFEVDMESSEDDSSRKRRKGIRGRRTEGKKSVSHRWKGKDKPVPSLMWKTWEEEHEGWIDQHLDSNVNDIDLEVESSNEPSNLMIPLLRFQKEWLAWALKQEASVIRGGILADEMGMGKTLQAISLVLAKQKSSGGLSSPTTSNASALKATLVVCPVVAVSQWVSEIERFTLKGSTSVLVYHGSNRTKDFMQFSHYDFIITTYSTVEYEYRKFMMPPKKTCGYCGKAFNVDKLKVHLKYFCGPDAVRTTKQAKQQRKSAKSDVKKVKKVDVDDKDPSVNLKRKRKTNVNEENDFYEVDELLRKKSVLHSAKWRRIILDEAHYIKDRRCNTAKAIFALESSYKWALSGTPLQNRVGELYSLIRFLQIVPYSFYLCKDCDCRTLDHRSAARCSMCPHNSVRHFCWWNKYVANPIKASANSDKGKRAMFLLKNKVLKNIVLRRTKLGRASDLALPSRLITLRRDTLDDKEEDYYESLYNESQAQFNTYVSAGTIMNNYAHIFDLLTRLRQAVDHPYLVVYSNTALKNGESTNDERAPSTCNLCQEATEDQVVSSCGHAFCKACLLDYSSSLGQVTCPTCSKLLTVSLSTDTGDKYAKTTIKGFKSSSILNRVQLNDFQTSTKIEALREEIRLMYERDSSAKGIVFSQFTQFLDLIRYTLQKSDINCVHLEGSMTLAARDAAIKKFTNDPDCKIFLMSLKAGGIALNLTVASHVFLMDPWWNPAVERQAQDRIHRIGQYKPIRIVRFVIQNTIEDRILRLQEKKELVFEGTVGGSTEALGKLTEGDLRFLFAS